MQHEFPGAVPEIPVSDIDLATACYKDQLGFTIDWGGEDGCAFYDFSWETSNNLP